MSLGSFDWDRDVNLPTSGKNAYEVITEQAYHRLTPEGRRAWLGHIERQVREIEAR